MSNGSGYSVVDVRLDRPLLDALCMEARRRKIPVSALAVDVLCARLGIIRVHLAAPTPAQVIAALHQAQQMARWMA